MKGNFSALGVKLIREKPKNDPPYFICALDLSNGLGLRSLKEKSSFGFCCTPQWAFENSTFSPVVHRDSWPVDDQKKSISLSIL
jgi:hypothetical protein